MSAVEPNIWLDPVGGVSSIYSNIKMGCGAESQNTKSHNTICCDVHGSCSLLNYRTPKIMIYFNIKNGGCGGPNHKTRNMHFEKVAFWHVGKLTFWENHSLTFWEIYILRNSHFDIMWNQHFENSEFSHFEKSIAWENRFLAFWEINILRTS